MLYKLGFAFRNSAVCHGAQNISEVTHRISCINYTIAFRSEEAFSEKVSQSALLSFQVLLVTDGVALSECIIIGKWSLPHRSSWTLQARSKYSERSQMLRSIADWEPVPGCRYVAEPSLRRDRLHCSIKSLIILPLLSFLEQPHSLLCALKSLSKSIGGGSWLIRSSRSFLVHFEVGGRYTEHTVIDLKHVVRTTMACREVLSLRHLWANMFLTSRATPPWYMPLLSTHGQW